MPTKETLLVDVCMYPTRQKCTQFKLDKSGSGKAYVTTSANSESDSSSSPAEALVSSWANITHPSMLYQGRGNGSIFELPLSAFSNTFPPGKPVFVNHEDARMFHVEAMNDCEVIMKDFGSFGQYAFRHCQIKSINSWIAYKAAGQDTGPEQDIITFLKQRGVADPMPGASNIQVLDLFLDNDNNLNLLGRAKVSDEFSTTDKLFKVNCSQ